MTSKGIFGYMEWNSTPTKNTQEFLFNYKYAKTKIIQNVYKNIKSLNYLSKTDTINQCSRTTLPETNISQIVLQQTNPKKPNLKFLYLMRSSGGMKRKNGGYTVTKNGPQTI